MFFIRLAFWVGLVVLLLPTDEGQQARLYDTATTTVERAVTFCDRNAGACAAGADFWATFVKKAEFGARIAIDLVSTGGRREETAVPTPVPVRMERERTRGVLEARPEPRLQPRAYPTARGTLTPADLEPPWRGQLHRTGT